MDNGFKPFCSVSNDFQDDGSDADLNDDAYIQLVKWIIPAKELNNFINFWIPTPSLPHCPDGMENTNIRVEKYIKPLWNLDCVLHSSDI